MRAQHYAILVFVACALIATLWFLLRDEHPVASEPDIETSLPVKTKPKHTAMQPIAPLEQYTPVEAVTPSASAALEPPLYDDPVMAEQPLHVPDYGEFIHRGGARAEFKLLDAKGGELDRSVMSYVRDSGEDGCCGRAARKSVRLLRRVGTHWSSDLRMAGAQWDDASSKDNRAKSGSATRSNLDESTMTIVCDGADGVGLEPGTYRLECELTPYGALAHEFTVLRGQRLNETLCLPNWPRVVCLHFKNQAGEDLPWLRKPPWYRAPQAYMKDKATVSQPRRALRSPPNPQAPSRSGSMRCGGADCGMCGGWRIPTDAGRYFISVFAGQSSTIFMEIDEKLFSAPPGCEDWRLHLESDFTGPEWDDYPVVLSPTEAYAEYGRTAPPMDMSNASARHLLQPKATPTEALPLSPFDSTRLSDGDWRIVAPAVYHTGGYSLPLRFIAGVGAGKSPARAAIEEVRREGRFFEPMDWGKDLRRQGEWQWIEPIQSYATAYLTDDFLYRGPVHYVCNEDGPIVTLPPPQEVLPTVITLRTSPTVDAIATSVSATSSLDIEPRGVLRDMEHPGAALGDGRTGYHVVTLLSTEMREQLSKTEVRLHLVYNKGRDTSAGRQPFHNASKTLAPTDVQALCNGALELDAAPKNGLVLRAVNSFGVGLPYVEATLISCDNDKLSRTLRRREKELAAQGQRPVLKADREKEQYESVTSDTEEAVVQALLGAKLCETFTNSNSRAWYCRNGAWYDTHQVLVSDEYGYMFDADMKLTPGKHYVLYLWSRSRDDLMPDKRIDFIASDRITDLGAVTLPGYE